MWEFQVFIKNIYNDNLKVVFKKYDKEVYTWRGAWVKALDDTIGNLDSGELIYSIVADNEIVRR